MGLLDNRLQPWELAVKAQLHQNANEPTPFEQVGGLLSDIWGGMDAYDKAALVASPVPVVGDVAGLSNDVRHYINDPESRTWGNYAMSGVGLLPFVPPVFAMTRKVTDLPMDEASRMARAKEMGFDTDQIWYHGTSADEFDEFDSKLLGSSSGAKDANHGFYFAKNPNTADAYRPTYQTIKPDKFKEHYGVSLGDFQKKIDAKRQQLIQMGIEDPDMIQIGLSKELRDAHREYKNMSMAVNPFHYDNPKLGLSRREWVDDNIYGSRIEAILPKNMMHHDYGGQAWNEGLQNSIIRQAKEEGYEGVIFEGMQDSGWFGGQGLDDIAIVFDSNRIRNPNAAFDPAKKDSANILASGLLGALGLGSYGLLSDDQYD